MQRLSRKVTEKFKLQSTSKQNPGLSVFLIFYISYIKEDKELKETTDLMLMSPAFFWILAHCCCGFRLGFDLLLPGIREGAKLYARLIFSI